MRKRYVSLDPVSLEELALQTGWVLTDNESQLYDEHGNRVYVLTEDDGYLSIQFDSDQTDASVILERVPFEEANVVQIVE